jgi:twitching motility protein PilT
MRRTSSRSKTRLSIITSTRRPLSPSARVGVDVPNFAEALRRALRQDPDIILVGEMRDLETIEAAITAAETGHLVFGTLHTTGAAKTIDRVVNAFPVNQQEQIRIQLSTVLQAVISQILAAAHGQAGSRGRL